MLRLVRDSSRHSKIICRQRCRPQFRRTLPPCAADCFSQQLLPSPSPLRPSSVRTVRHSPRQERGRRRLELAPHRPLPKPVNLKVLPKDIAPEELEKIMHGYAGSLGVKCNFCHAANQQTHKLDFASDAKEDKGFARTMIAMTQTINDQYMSKIDDPDAMPADKHVTCGTCHRGHTMPEHFVPPPETHHPSQQGAPEAQPPQ